MREIKFRAWCEGKTMFPNSKRLLMVKRDFGEVWNKGDGIIWMQFTGLLDKNGKEIYEGDILQLHCGSEDGATERHKIKAEVMWNKDRFVASIPNKIVKVKGGSEAGKMLSWREIHTWCGMHTCLLEWQSKLEIIGNLYENPELLK